MLEKWELLIPDLEKIFDYSKSPENDPWKDPSNPSSSAMPPPPQFSSRRTQPPPPPPRPKPPPHPPAPPLPPAPFPPPWCPPVRGTPEPSPVAPVLEPVADVFYSVEELAQIAHLASRPVRQVRPMALLVIGTQQAPTPAPALTPNQVRLRDRIVMCFNCNSPGHFARDCRLFYDLRQMGIRIPHKQCAKLN